MYLFRLKKSDICKVRPYLFRAVFVAAMLLMPAFSHAQDLGVPSDAPPQNDLKVPDFDIPSAETIEKQVEEDRGQGQQMKPVEAAKPKAAAKRQPPVPELLPVREEESGDISVSGGTGRITPAPDHSRNDVFYDAGNVVPQGEQSKKAARKVDPRVEPASRLIVVRRTSGPGSRQAQLVSASRALKLGRYESALDMYRSLYKKNPRDFDALLGVAVSLQRMENFDAAIAAYEELLELQPDNVEAKVNMLGLISRKYPAVGLERLKQLQRKNPDNISVVAQMAVAHAQLGHIDDALKYLGIAASMQPQNPSHLFNMAVITDRAGKKAEAIKFYEKALELDTIYGGGRSLPRNKIYKRLSLLR